MKLKKKIVITGGHVTPALAVIDILQKKYPEIEIVFIGRKYVNEREKSESFEYKEIASRKIRFIHLVTGRFTRAFTVGALQNILTIPYGFSRAYTIIKKEKPDAIALSFGGQTALNCGINLYKTGIFKKYGVSVLGTSIDSIIISEDRDKFANHLHTIHVNTPKSKAATQCVFLLTKSTISTELLTNTAPMGVLVFGVKLIVLTFV
jgi:UDP-N-acetylglucosamine:LPS N-acetylglucosamine transferase